MQNNVGTGNFHIASRPQLPVTADRDIGKGTVYRVVPGRFCFYARVATKITHEGETTTKYGLSLNRLALNDAQWMQRLDHSGLTARMYHMQAFNDSPTVILFVEAYHKNLKDHIDQLHAGTVPLGEAYDPQIIFSQLLKAVEFLHAQRVIHCDIRCKNIYFRVNGKRLSSSGIYISIDVFLMFQAVTTRSNSRTSKT